MRRGWLAAVGGVRRAHDADPVAVGVADHGVASAPEGVVGLLLHRHAVGGQIGHQVVDLVAAVHLEPEDKAGTARPALVPPGSEGLAVEVHVDRRAVAVDGRDVVVRPDGVVVLAEVEAEAAVEGPARSHVAHDEVHLIEPDRCHRPP